MTPEGFGSNTPYRVIRTIAVSRVHDRIKKGAERKIFLGSSVDQYKSLSVQVRGKKTKQTGFYYPEEYGYRGGYLGEPQESYDPGGLDNRKTVICFDLSVSNCRLFDRYDEWEGFWLTADQITWKGKQ